MSQHLWYIRNCSIFRRLNEDQLSRLERRARMRDFPRNSVIYLPADEAESAFLLVLQLDITVLAGHGLFFCSG